jgi:glycine cleavage system regulatory protein
LTAEDLSTALEQLRGGGVRVSVAGRADTDAGRDAAASWAALISYEGADRPGLLETMANVLTAAGCEFVDLRIEHGYAERSESTVLVCEVDVPDSLSREELEALTVEVGERYHTVLMVVPAHLEELILSN